MKEVGSDSSGAPSGLGSATSCQFKTSLDMPLDRVGAPVVDQFVEHLEAHDVGGELNEVLEHRDLRVLYNVVEGMALHAVPVLPH